MMQQVQIVVARRGAYLKTKPCRPLEGLIDGIELELCNDQSVVDAVKFVDLESQAGAWHVVPRLLDHAIAEVAQHAFGIRARYRVFVFLPRHAELRRLDV